MLCGNKDKHAIFRVSENQFFKEADVMRRKSRMILLLLPGISAEVKTKPKLEVRKKTTAAGQKCQLKLNGVSGRAR